DTRLDDSFCRRGFFGSRTRRSPLSGGPFGPGGFGFLRVTKRATSNLISTSGLRGLRPGHPEPSCVLYHGRVKWKSPVQGPGFSAVGGVRLDRAIPAVGIRHRAKYPCTLMRTAGAKRGVRSEEHTSELQSRENLVCRLLLEKKK